MKRRYVNRKCKTRKPWWKRPITLTYTEQINPAIGDYMGKWVAHLATIPTMELTFQDLVDEAVHDLKYAILLENCALACYRAERATVPVGTFQRYRVGESDLRESKERHRDIRRVLQHQRKLRENASTSTPVAA